LIGPMNILFICSRNQWRSPTVEQVWRKLPGIKARSAGTSPKAKHPVNHADIQWADVIFVMEPKHKQRLQAEFRQLLNHKQIEVLDIPDEYQYMAPDLVEIFEALGEDFLDNLGDRD
jgi:predicted protein tyrosine phosphatase